MNTILTFLERNRQRLELERYGASTRLSYVVVTQQLQTSSCVVFLILAEGKPDPVLVVKVPRLAGANASVEREVANLVARGLTNRQIAKELVLSERTVENHVRNILKKLKLSSRSEVAAWVEAL